MASSAARQYVPEKGEPEFLIPPPPEIGALISAHTSLTRERPDKPSKRVGFLLLLGAGITLVLGAGFVVANNFFAAPLPLPMLAVMLGLIAVAVYGVILFFVVLSTRPLAWTGYVGAAGAAFVECTRQRANLTTNQTLLFREAAELRRSCVEYHDQSHGGYLGTRYKFTWTDETGKPLLKFEGSHLGKDNPPRTVTYQLGREAEDAWSRYLLDKLTAGLEAGRGVTFRLSGRDHVVLDKGGLELHVRGRVQRFGPHDLKEITIADDKIELKEPGAREGWFTSEGIHRFSFAEMANALAFLLLVQRIFEFPLDFRR